MLVNILDTPECCSVCICIANSRVPTTICLTWPKNSSARFTQPHLLSGYSHGNWHLRGWLMLGKVVCATHSERKTNVCMYVCVL